MFILSNRLGPKLILTTLVFLLVLATATALLVTTGFRQTQNDATRSSIEGLETQGRDALVKLTDREATIATTVFQQAVSAVEQAEHHFVKMVQLGGSVPWDSRKNLIAGGNGSFYDPRPDRISDLWLPISVKEIGGQLEHDIRDSANLDTLVPSLLADNPDFAAIYYLTDDGLTRYYPIVNLHEFVEPQYDLMSLPFYGPVTPRYNPERKTIWTPTYIDPAGQGLIVSAATPVYNGDQFRGVIGVDISLRRLIDYLNALKPTENSSGYAFLVDSQGRLIAAPPTALDEMMGMPIASTMTVTETLGLNLNRSTNAAFRGVLDAMQDGKNDITRIDIGGKPSFVSYAPLPSIGWSLGIVAPVSDVIAESAKVEAAIRSGTDQTVRSTLITMILFFSLALVGTVVISRRLTRPIAALAAGTRAVASGNLDITIPVTSRDELGMLAASFNQMTSELATNKRRLETWSQTLEQTVQERTADLAEAIQVAQEARAAAEQANELKTQFLANMSHELRTPLNSIINFTRILMSGMRGPVNEGQIDYLNRVRNSGEHLLGLINDILDLSKIEAGRMELFKEQISIGDLVHSVMSSAVGLIKGKPIELHHVIEPDLPIIEADRTRVRQVLLNLLSNAAKFTDTGAITVRVIQQAEHVVISVSDTGIGIAPEDQELIFEEFRQVDGGSTRRYEGTGLGLAICRQLIELHGGRIWVESQPGAGATFSFTLPSKAVLLTTDVSLPLVTTGARGARILVIDDDPAAIEIVATYLSRDGHSVSGVTDSRQAVEQARRLKPSAIILDVLMPHKDGWEVLSALKNDPELKLVPVVLYSIMEEQKLGFYLGANAYLTKPIDEGALRYTVAQMVASNATILVIDDDPDAVEIVSMELDQSGTYSIMTANNGRIGLERIRNTRPDLVILDLMMPEVDGFAVLEHLEANEETRSIPVIVLTAKDLSSTERAFLNQRVSGLLTKGLTSAGELLEKVSELLGTVAEHSSNSTAHTRRDYAS